LSYVNNDYIHYFTRPEMLKAITFWTPIEII
jgi:hypothetical protein